MHGKVVHCKRDEHDVYIGRGGPWGNPFRIGPGRTREQAIEQYRAWLWKEIKWGRYSLAAVASLRGKRLGCYCAPEACHGDVLLAAAKWAHEQLNQENGRRER